MFSENILDKIKDSIASIATCLIILLGVALGYFIDGGFLGVFTGWWLFTFGLIVLIGIVGEFVINFRRHTKKEVFSYLLTIGLLAVLIYLLYRTLV